MLKSEANATESLSSLSSQLISAIELAAKAESCHDVRAQMLEDTKIIRCYHEILKNALAQNSADEALKGANLMSTVSHGLVDSSWSP